MQHHKYNLSDIENMLPWEKSVYVTMLVNFIKEENEKLQQEKITKSKR
jgi:hypothetical protein